MLELVIISLGAGWWLMRKRPDLAVSVGRYTALAATAVVLVAFASGLPILLGRRPSPSVAVSPARYEQLHVAHQLASHVLMIGIGLIAPLLMLAPFGRVGASRKRNIIFATGALLFTILLLAADFTGFLVPPRVSFREWIAAEAAAGRVAPEGAILRFIVLHCAILPALLVSLALVMARKLRPAAGGS